MRIFFFLFLFCLGAGIGSFVCCQARRMRIKETKKGKKKKLGKRSVCLHCGYQLSWSDNIPIFSWLFLRGKCRKCGKKIGVLEILSEVLLAVAFLIVGVFSGDVLKFSGFDFLFLVFKLVFVSVLFFLAIYDGQFGELPQGGLTFSVICGMIILILKQWSLFLSEQNFQFLAPSLLSALGGVGILAGVYFLIFFFSKERLVGGGDWILGLAISLALGDFFLSLLVVFLSNFLALVFMLPSMRGKKEKKIFFGPWMILAFFIVFILQKQLSSLIGL